MWGLGERLQDMERCHVTSVHKFTDLCLFFSMIVHLAKSGNMWVNSDSQPTTLSIKRV